MENTKDSKGTWRQWDPIPPAFEPCKDDREERRYDLALSDPNRCYGLGTQEDPLVVWIDKPDYHNRNLVWAHNDFAKAIAKVLGLTHTWIIKGAHDRQYARDAEGRRIPISPDKYLLEEADTHITLRLGTGLYECNLSAHVYVLLDEDGNPARYMDELARKFRHGDTSTKAKAGEGGDPQLTFWPWRNNRRRFLPRRPINLGPNWEVHANVGPYLDTYRPDGKRAGDTYTPRSHGTPPREEQHDKTGVRTADDYKVIEGAMTRELAALVARSNAAYAVYKEFHMRLVMMDYPPADGLRELHAMREHIATMQRDIYREGMGFIV